MFLQLILIVLFSLKKITWYLLHFLHSYLKSYFQMSHKFVYGNVQSYKHAMFHKCIYQIKIFFSIVGNINFSMLNKQPERLREKSFLVRFF